jgi:hypothetical protein
VTSGSLMLEAFTAEMFVFVLQPDSAGAALPVDGAVFATGFVEALDAGDRDRAQSLDYAVVTCVGNLSQGAPAARPGALARVEAGTSLRTRVIEGEWQAIPFEGGQTPLRIGWLTLKPRTADVEVLTRATAPPAAGTLAVNLPGNQPFDGLPVFDDRGRIVAVCAQRPAPGSSGDALVRATFIDPDDLTAMADKAWRMHEERGANQPRSP